MYKLEVLLECYVTDVSDYGGGLLLCAIGAGEMMQCVCFDVKLTAIYGIKEIYGQIEGQQIFTRYTNTGNVILYLSNQVSYSYYSPQVVITDILWFCLTLYRQC